MKYGLMVVGHDKIINIGDYIQGLASMQFLPSVDCFVEREKLSSYDGDYIKMIMNSWYMHNPDSWPPSNKIDPLYVAVHINNKIKEDTCIEINKIIFTIVLIYYLYIKRILK